MSINPITTSFRPIEPIITPKTKGAGEIQESKSGANFGDMFKNAINEIDGMHKEADKKIEDITLGRGGVTAHEAMLALEKADTAFQLMGQIRAKIIRAYEEVMRTAV